MDLLDELTLMIHPVLVGKGKKLFTDGLDLKKLQAVEFEKYRFWCRFPDLSPGAARVNQRWGIPPMHSIIRSGAIQPSPVERIVDFLT